MKLSYECKNIIEELLEEIDIYGLDEKCVVIKEKGKEYFTDYLLNSEFNEFKIGENEEFYYTTLFNALVIFIEENSVIDRGKIAYKLLAARNIAGLTQKQVADQMGIEYKNYAKWETGERKPKIDNLKKIAEICNIDITYLI